MTPGGNRSPLGMMDLHEISSNRAPQEKFTPSNRRAATNAVLLLSPVHLCPETEAVGRRSRLLVP